MWEVSYTKNNHGQRICFNEDSDLNFPEYVPQGESADEAIADVIAYITEVYACNCLRVECDSGALLAFDGMDEEPFETYENFVAKKVYTLTDCTGKPYKSYIPGTMGGHRKLKIYGKLDCPSALCHIAKGGYVQHRVFFANEAIAISAGYRPCGICMKEEYKRWKSNQTQEADTIFMPTEEI